MGNKNYWQAFCLNFIILFTLTGALSYTVHAENNVLFRGIDSTQVQRLLEQSRNASLQGNYDMAMDLATQAEKLSKDNNDMEGITKSLTYMADILIDLGNTDEALPLIEGAIENYPNSIQIAQLYNLRGSVYSIKDQPTLAAEDFNNAMLYLDRLPKDESDRLNASLLHNLALIYQQMGQLDRAYINYLEAIKYGKASQDSAFLAIAYNNIGEAYNSAEEFEKAGYYLERSLEIARKKQSMIDIYRAELNLANTLSNIGEYEKALIRYDEAEKAMSVMRPGVPSPIIMHNRGSTLAKMQRYDEAEDLLFTSLELSESAGIDDGIYYNNYVLGNLYSERERHEEAIQYLEKAKLIAESSVNATRKLEILKALHEANAEAERYEEAYNIFLEYSSVSDSLNEAEKQRELEKAESLLELDRQTEMNELLTEKQIQQEKKLQSQLVLIAASILVIILISILLYQMKTSSRDKEKMYTQLKSQKEELEEINKSKDKLFAMVAHDLRSPLMSLQGILSLIKNEMLSQDEIQEMLPQLEGSLQENSNVMEDLLTWAKEQLSGVQMRLEEIEPAILIEDVVQSQAFIAEKKKVNLILEDITSAPLKADYNALLLIIRNIISNAIKFTHSGDSVMISAYQDKEYVIIKVEDTGIGIPKEAEDKIFGSTNWTRKGTQNEKGTGFGLSLSKEFSERMGGNIWFESEAGKGTTFFVKLQKFE